MLAFIRVAKEWWCTWHTLPVFSWIQAARFYRSGKFTKAIAYYQKGLRSHSKHPASFCARLDLAYCFFKTGQLVAAENELKAVLHHNPSLREAYLRLADLQLWTGQALEAAWTMRRALRHLDADAELVANFLQAVLENGGPLYLLQEAINASQRLDSVEELPIKLQVAKARLAMLQGHYQQGRDQLAKLVAHSEIPVVALTAFAEVLVKEGQSDLARQQLKRAMLMAPDCPRVLSLLAQTYLCSGENYNSEYAIQLATSACQNSQWLSPREMHVLAEAHYHSGDKMSALLIASRAKQAGSKLLGAYRDNKSLERLIQDLSSGTLA